jgi:hypothetical protein
VASQPVAPQIMSVMLQAAVQQRPVPLIPQLFDEQEALDVHAAPSASSAMQMPPLQE